MNQLLWNFTHLVMKVLKRFCENSNPLTLSGTERKLYEKLIYFLSLKINFLEVVLDVYSIAV